MVRRALVLVLMGCATALAQEPEPSPAPEATPNEAAPPPAADTPPAETTIADDTEAAADPVEEARERLRGAHIGELAGRTRMAIQTTRPLLRANGELTRIERTIPILERDVHALAHPSRLERIPHLSQRELSDLRAAFRRHAHDLDDAQATLTERISELEEARTNIVELRRTWSELRDVSIAAGRPAERHERIVSQHDATRSVANALDESRDRYAALSDRVSELQAVVEDVADRLREAAGAYRGRLRIRDVPAIWEGLGGEEGGSVVDMTRDSVIERVTTPVELLADLLPMALALAVFAALVLGALLILARGRARAEASAVQIGPFAAEVLTHPYAATTLLALLVATVFLEHAPIAVYDLVFFATLVPLWRAVPPLCPPETRDLVRGAIVFVAVDRLQAMLPEGTSLLRVVLLAECAVVAGLGAVWVRRFGAAPRSLALRTVRAAVFLGVLTLAAASLANLLGYLFLATVLTRGIGYSTYAALAASGGVIVLESIVDLAIASPEGRKLRTVAEHGELVRARTFQLLMVVAFVLWIVSTLDGFGLWSSVSSGAEELFAESHAVGTVELSFGAILGAFGILFATWALLRFVRFVLELDVLPRLSLEPGVDGAISGLTRYVIGGVGLLFALAFLGIDAEQIALVAGALGVGIGFGLQGIVANFIAGIVLMVERPVRLGDFVEVGPLVGRVDRIGLRSSTVKAMDGAEVIVPNESLISRELINWTLSDRKRRVEVKVGVAYGTDLGKVQKLLEGVIAAHEGVVQFERSRTLFDGFGESSLDFSVQFWVGSYEDGVRLKSDVALSVYEALTKGGVEIPFPQRDIRIVSVPEVLTRNKT